MKLIRIVQDFSSQPKLLPGQIGGAVKSELKRVLAQCGQAPGRCILGLGSRGIPNYLQVCRATADCLRELGWEVGALAAMGTHGGDDAAQEIQLLASRHGITAHSLGGVEMLSGSEAVKIGATEQGIDVFFAQSCIEWGGKLVPVNRIKAHTHMTRSVHAGRTLQRGSGPFKMLSIGFGKGAGAREVHAKAQTFWSPASVKNTETLGDALESVGRFVIDHNYVLAGVGIVDNAGHCTAHVTGLDPACYFEDEIDWLQRANSYLPNLPFVPDVLIVDTIGKNISGTGAAPQVIRRWPDMRSCTPAPAVLAMLRLSEESHGSAFGIGWADVTTASLVRSIDVAFTQANTHGAGDPELGEPPAIQCDTDWDAVERAISLGAVRTKKAREQVTVLFIRDTNSLEEIYYFGPELALNAPALQTAFSIDLQLVESNQLQKAVSDLWDRQNRPNGASLCPLCGL